MNLVIVSTVQLSFYNKIQNSLESTGRAMCSSEAICVNTPWIAKSFAERNKCMWNNSLLADVEFSFPESSTDNKYVVVPAHSYILAISSPVFFNMLTGNSRNRKTTVEITDSDPEIFRIFLLYLYCEELEFTIDRLQGLLRLATKYSVLSLVQKCVEFMKDNLNTSSVFLVLQCAEFLEDKTLQKRCWEIVDLKANEVIKSDGFLNLDEDFMVKFLQRDSLVVREIELFKAFDNWTAFQSGKQDQNLRLEEGKYVALSKLVNYIRFPLMSQKEFAETVPQTNLLFKEDIINMFSFFCSVSNVNMRFSRKPRAGMLKRCCLFPESRKWFMYSGSCPEYLTFSVNSSILLYGVRMFGYQSGKYSVFLEIYAHAKPTKILAARKGIHESDSEVKDRYFGFDVVLDEPCPLKANTSYTIKVLLEGPPSFYGCHGYSVVECDGITFSFSRDNCPIFSRFRVGQFAEIIFLKQ